MKIHKLNSMVRGWFIGDFEPSILRTKDFEVGILDHKKGEAWPVHYHKEAVEYNVLLEGKMMVRDKIISAGDIFIFDAYEVADPVFLEDCKVVCIKCPSLPNDKYEV